MEQITTTLVFWNNMNLLSHRLEARSLKSKCQQIWLILLEALRESFSPSFCWLLPSLDIPWFMDLSLWSLPLSSHHLLYISLPLCLLKKYLPLGLAYPDKLKLFHLEILNDIFNKLNYNLKVTFKASRWRSPFNPPQSCTTLWIYWNHWTVKFKTMNFMVCELYFNKREITCKMLSDIFIRIFLIKGSAQRSI